MPRAIHCFAVGLPSLLWLAAGLNHLVVVAKRPGWEVAPPSSAQLSRPLSVTNRGAFLRGWPEGLVCLRSGWLLMLAVAGDHRHLGAMVAATVLMSAPSYMHVPRWSRSAAGAVLALVGAKLLLALP